MMADRTDISMSIGDSSLAALPDVSAVNPLRQEKSPHMIENAATGRLSPIRKRTTRDIEQQIEALQQENFDLKLRVYFLEQQKGVASDDTLRTNIDLKVQLQSLQTENRQKQQLWDDICSQYELQIRNLEQQILASQSNSMSDQEGVELNLAREELRKTQQILRETQDELEQSAESAENFKVDLAELKSQVKNLEVQLAAKTHAVTDLGQLKAEQGRQIQELKDRLLDQGAQLSTLQPRLHEAAHFKNQYEDVVTQLQSQSLQIEKLQEMLDQSDRERGREAQNCSNLTKSLEKANQCINNLDGVVISRDRELAARARELESTRSHIQQLEQVVGDRDSQIQELLQRLNDMQSQLDEINSDSRQRQDAGAGSSGGSEVSSGPQPDVRGPPVTVDEIQAELAKHQEVVSNLESQLLELSHEQVDGGTDSEQHILKEQIASLLRLREQDQSIIETLKQQIAAIDSSCNLDLVIDMAKQIKQNEDTIAQLKKSARPDSARSGSSSSSRSSIYREEIDALRRELNEAKAQATEAQHQASEAQNQLSELPEKFVSREKLAATEQLVRQQADEKRQLSEEIEFYKSLLKEAGLFKPFKRGRSLRQDSVDSSRSKIPRSSSANARIQEPRDSSQQERDGTESRIPVPASKTSQTSNNNNAQSAPVSLLDEVLPEEFLRSSTPNDEPQGPQAGEGMKAEAGEGAGDRDPEISRWLEEVQKYGSPRDLKESLDRSFEQISYLEKIVEGLEEENVHKDEYIQSLEGRMKRLEAELAGLPNGDSEGSQPNSNGIARQRPVDLHSIPDSGLETSRSAAYQHSPGAHSDHSPTGQSHNPLHKIGQSQSPLHPAHPMRRELSSGPDPAALSLATRQLDFEVEQNSSGDSTMYHTTLDRTAERLRAEVQAAARGSPLTLGPIPAQDDLLNISAETISRHEGPLEAVDMRDYADAATSPMKGMVHTSPVKPGYAATSERYEKRLMSPTQSANLNPVPYSPSSANQVSGSPTSANETTHSPNATTLDIRQLQSISFANPAQYSQSQTQCSPTLAANQQQATIPIHSESTNQQSGFVNGATNQAFGSPSETNEISGSSQQTSSNIPSSSDEQTRLKSMSQYPLESSDPAQANLNNNSPLRTVLVENKRPRTPRLSTPQTRVDKCMQQYEPLIPGFDPSSYPLTSLASQNLANQISALHGSANRTGEPIDNLMDRVELLPNQQREFGSPTDGVATGTQTYKSPAREYLDRHQGVRFSPRESADASVPDTLSAYGHGSPRAAPGYGSSRSAPVYENAMNDSRVDEPYTMYSTAPAVHSPGLPSILSPNVTPETMKQYSENLALLRQENDLLRSRLSNVMEEVQVLQQARVQAAGVSRERINQIHSQKEEEMKGLSLEHEMDRKRQNSEINQLLDRIRELEKAIEEKNRLIAEQEKRIRQTKAQLDISRHDLTESREMFAESQKNLGYVKESQEFTQRQLEAIQDDLVNLNKANKDLQTQLKESENELRDRNNKLSLAETSRAQLQARLGETEARMQQEIQSLESQVQEERLEAARNVASLRERGEKRVEGERERLRKLEEKYKEDTDKLRIRLEDANKESGDMFKNLVTCQNDSSRKTKSLEEQLAEKQDLLSALTDKYMEDLKNADMEILELKNQLSKAKILLQMTSLRNNNANNNRTESPDGRQRADTPNRSNQPESPSHVHRADMHNGVRPETPGIDQRDNIAKEHHTPEQASLRSPGFSMDMYRGSSSENSRAQSPTLHQPLPRSQSIPRLPEPNLTHRAALPAARPTPYHSPPERDTVHGRPNYDALPSEQYGPSGWKSSLGDLPSTRGPVFAFSDLKNYEMLKRQNQEALSSLSCVSARVQARLDTFTSSNPLDSQEWCLLQEVQKLTEALKACLFACSSHISKFNFGERGIDRPKYERLVRNYKEAMSYLRRILDSGQDSLNPAQLDRIENNLRYAENNLINAYI